MSGQPRKREVFANPFFVVLLAASSLFVLTVLGYLVSPYVLERKPGGKPQSQGSLAVAAWLDRHAPAALGIEFLVMLAAGILAMATDRWFSPRSRAPQAGKKR
jgi:hypothetical protein